MTVLKRLPGRFGRSPRRVPSLPKKVEAFYASVAWREYRKGHRAWTKRKHGGVWCAKCGSTHRLILDHVVERRDGGDDLPAFDGAEWLCSGCHNAKTARAKAARVSRSGDPGGGQKSGG